MPSPSRPPAASSPSGGFLTDLSRFFGTFRWAFLPLGLVALVAVGAHAAADTLDDRLLAWVDRADAAFDAFAGEHPATAPWVDWVSLEVRVRIARMLALAWELGAVWVLALPLLGYREAKPLAPAEAWRQALEPRSGPPGRREQWLRWLRRPTLLRWLRPLTTAAVALAGACTVARLVQGTVYLSWRELFGEIPADFAARSLAVGALVGVLATLGWRGVLRSLEHADAVSERDGGRRAFFRGFWGCVVTVPLAVAAVMDASPVLSFLR